MRVLVLSNGELMEKEIDNTLEALQGIVGGYIEIPYVGEMFMENGIDIIINEEGKFIDGLKPEIVIVEKKTNAILDMIYGNCIFASHDKDGNTIGLSDEQKILVLNEIMVDAVLTNADTNKEVVAKALFV